MSARDVNPQTQKKLSVGYRSRKCPAKPRHPAPLPTAGWGREPDGRKAKAPVRSTQGKFFVCLPSGHGEYLQPMAGDNMHLTSRQQKTQPKPQWASRVAPMFYEEALRAWQGTTKRTGCVA